MSPTSAYDVIVIGSGSGGLTAAIGLARFGKRIALVERGAVGGDCTNTGCIPSKRLIHLARTAGPQPDAAAILADVRATRDGLSTKERHELEADPNITPVWGTARLASPRSVVVDGVDGARTLTAQHIVIATGSRARELAIRGLPPDRLLTNETLFECAAAPRHLVIVGAGAIGLEMAAAFRRLGTRVTVLDIADRVLPLAIPEASAALRDGLVSQGIDVRTSTRIVAYEPDTRTLRVHGQDRDEGIPGVDAVLVAIGRVPNVDGLTLEAAGLGADNNGIPVDTWGRTSTKGIWAVGDVTLGSHQTHAANALGRRIIQRIALPWLPPTGRPPLIPSAVFSEPEVAWAGRTQAEIARRYHPNAVTRIRIDFADQDRGLTDGVDRGFVCIDAIRLTGRIVAATVVGPNASELIAPLTLAITRGISLLRLSRTVYAYPTFAGAIGAAGDEFARATLPHLAREARAYARYRLRRPRRASIE